MHILEPKMNKSPLQTKWRDFRGDKDRALKCVILILVTQNTNWIRAVVVLCKLNIQGNHCPNNLANVTP